MINVNEEILKVIREAGFFFYATTEDGNPRVRPLGYIDEIGGKLVIAISTTKAMAKQTLAKPDFEICASTPEHWIRVKGTAKVVTDTAVAEKVLECPVFKGRMTIENIGAFELAIDSAEYFTLAGEYSCWK